ncbi:MAG: c-type cytochrome [Vicinamibacterales bacterium]
MRLTLSPRLTTLAAVLAAAVVVWFAGRPLPEIEQQRRHFAALQRQIRLAESTKAARQADRGRLLRVQAQARLSQGAQKAAFDAEAAALAEGIGWGDTSVVRAALRDTPMVPVSRTTTLEGVPDARPERGTGCQACHIGIATPGLEKYPAPFRTHPMFASYVGAASPHPPSRVGCASCHMGDEYAATFEGAGHSTLRTGEEAGTPGVRRRWTPLTAAAGMLPVGRTEAGCVGCHQGEVVQPGAPGISDALALLDRGGCQACHVLPGQPATTKRGPDLRRIRGKLTPEWVRAWLENPQAVKPATWMPRFWSNPDPIDLAAIDAVTAYLFGQPDAYTPAVANPSSGDAVRGRQLVESVGCLGCHVVGEVDRQATSVRRTFGQPLQALAGKAGHAWLVDWVREPHRYSPATRMPSLRLSLDEASDVAAYLRSLSGGPSPTPAGEASNDARLLEVIARYGKQPVVADGARRVSGEALQRAAGGVVIASLGCARCHVIEGVEDRKPDVPLRPRPVWRGPDAAVHTAAAVPVKGQPMLALGPREAEQAALALTALAGRSGEGHALSTPWHLTKARGRALTAQRNCLGCHVIEGHGGDVVSLVAEPTLGPPLLTPEGSRVQPAWLTGFLHEPTTIRPWLAVRMPTFHLSDDEVAQVGNYFRGIAPENPTPAAAAAGVTPASGQALFELLKCQQCHVLGSIPTDQPTSNLAPDLRMARERLQPDWILAWLRNPGAILPGTRMPTFWPDYPKSFYEPLDKDGQKQVRAIRDHLLALR